MVCRTWGGLGQINFNDNLIIMKQLKDMLEGLLNSDFDIKDTDVTTDTLCKWLGIARKMKISDAIKSLTGVMAQVPEINPMKRSNMAETNTIVSFQDNHGVAYLSIVYRGKQSCFSHISYSWMGYANDRPSVSKGKGNLIEFKNKRKHPDLHCWALPAEAFDTLYNSVR